MAEPERRRLRRASPAERLRLDLPDKGVFRFIMYSAEEECWFYRFSKVKIENYFPPEKATVPHLKGTRSARAIFTAPPILGDRRRRARSDADKRDLYFKVLGVACTSPPTPSPCRGGGVAIYPFALYFDGGRGGFK